MRGDWRVAEQARWASCRSSMGPLFPSPILPLASPAVDPNVDFRLFPLYKDEVQRGFEEECWRRGYAMMVAGASRANGDAVLTDIAGRVDGLAIFLGIDRRRRFAPHRCTFARGASDWLEAR